MFRSHMSHAPLANHANEGNWKHVSRELKTDWGKGAHACLDGGILVVGEGETREANRIMETFPEWSE